MDTARCLKTADRIAALLRAELGEDIDRRRLVLEPLYARDVLLVCDAHAGHAQPELALLPGLARQFRAALAAPHPLHRRASGFDLDRAAGAGPSAAGVAAPLPHDTPGLQPAPADTATGVDADSQPPQLPGAALPRRRARWFSPSRWLAGK